MSKDLIVKKYAPFVRGVLFIGGEFDGTLILDPPFDVSSPTVRPRTDLYRWFDSLSGGTVQIYVLESLNDDDIYQEIYCKCVNRHYKGVMPQ